MQSESASEISEIDPAEISHGTSKKTKRKEKICITTCIYLGHIIRAEWGKHMVLHCHTT